MKKVRVNDIGDASRRVETLKHDYLIQHGWKYTRNAFGLFRLYEKKLEACRILVMDREQALRYEEWIS